MDTQEGSAEIFWEKKDILANPKVAYMKCVPTAAQYYSGRVDGWMGGWVEGWVHGWVALEEWKLRLTQPPAGVN